MASPDPASTVTKQLCQCDCGVKRVVEVSSVRRGDSNGCKGCGQKTHGESPRNRRSPEYSAWASMQSRCKPRHKNHDRYFDRGIRVCDEWLGQGGFERFLDHVGRRPGKSFTFDRIDNNRGYKPGNVRWVTWETQQRNKGNNRMVTIDDQTRCVAAWSEISGINQQVIGSRLSTGWEPKRAVFEKVGVARQFDIDGKSMSVTEWAKVSGVNRVVVSARLAKGWDPKRAVFTPVTKERLIEIDGETLCVAEWARRSGVKYITIVARLNRGWDPKRAVFDSPR